MELIAQKHDDYFISVISTININTISDNGYIIAPIFEKDYKYIVKNKLKKIYIDASSTVSDSSHTINFNIIKLLINVNKITHFSYDFSIDLSMDNFIDLVKIIDRSDSLIYVRLLSINIDFMKYIILVKLVERNKKLIVAISDYNFNIKNIKISNNIILD